MRPMSLSQYRSTIKIMGEKSTLFAHKNEIFEAVEMDMSLVQIVDFLKLHGVKISKQALDRWVLSQKTYQPKINVGSTPFSQKIESKQENSYTVEPRVEPKEASIPKPIDDDFYNHLRKVADKRAKWLGTNPYITQETQNENSSLQQ